MATTPPKNIWFPTQSTQPKQTNNDGKILIFAIISLIIVVVLIILLHLYIRHVIRRRAHRPFINLTISPNQQTSTNKGLDPSLFLAIPVFSYVKKGEDESTAECAVCLTAIAEGEMVRSLPKCRHMFHESCIDVWFHSHSTCPVCRANVEVDEITEEPSTLSVLGMEKPVYMGLKEGGLGSGRVGESLRRMWSGRAVVEDIERQ